MLPVYQLQLDFLCNVKSLERTATSSMHPPVPNPIVEVLLKTVCSRTFAASLRIACFLVIRGNGASSAGIAEASNLEEDRS